MLFKIIWIDDNGTKVGEDDISKQNMGLAIRSAALRMRQSFHLCPKETYGFYVTWTDLVDKSRNI